MSDILNPLGGRFLGQTSPSSATAVLGTVPDPPNGLRLVDPGTIIKGVVLGRESDGLTAIATDKGTIRVASNTPLVVGQQVTLEVRATGDRLQVLILASDLIQKATTPQSGPGSVSATQAGPQATGTTSGTVTSSPVETRGTTAQTAPAPLPRNEPSIQFVGSTLRAVVVQAPPATLPTTPPPTPSTTSPAPLPQQATPLPLPPTPVQTPVEREAQPRPNPPQNNQPPAIPRPVTPPQVALPQAGLPPAPVPQVNPPQATLPEAPSPQANQPAPPPQAGMPAPPQPPANPPQALPPTPAPQAGIPAPAPPPANPSQALPPAPAPQAAIPAPLPPLTSSAPPVVTTAPVTTTPTTPVPLTPTPTTSTPAPTIPTPTTPPAVGVPPQGVSAPIIAATAPLSAAAMQAAMLAASERKTPGALPPVTTLAVNAVTPALAAQEYADHDATSGRLPGQGSAAPAPLPAGLAPGAAFSADTRERILALFASAGVSPGEELTDSLTTPAKVNAAPLPIGAELKLRVLAVQMQLGQAVEFDPIAADPRDLKGNVIFGRVTAITPAGHAIIRTPAGDIMLQDRSSLEIGARIALTIDTLEAAPPPAATMMPVVSTPQQALLTLSQGWPTLADLIAVFQGSTTGAARGSVDPEVAREALAMLPHVGVKLGAGIMNAMAALRAGDIGRLIGPLFALKGAGVEREEAVRRLKSEFAQLSALAQERPEVDWRALFLPIIDDQGRVTQVNLFYRRPKKGSGQEQGNAGTGTRFVVEADFSRLGPFQLDGLMRAQRFDLMIRSRTRLTDRMRRDIEAIYEEARGLTGFAGSIAFQTVDEFPVIPLDELKRGTPTVMV